MESDPVVVVREPRGLHREHREEQGLTRGKKSVDVKSVSKA